LGRRIEAQLGESHDAARALQRRPQAGLPILEVEEKLLIS